MSYVTIAAYLIFAVYLITRFGTRIASKASGLWWAVLVFLGLVVVAPNLLRPVSELIGFQLPSNFVFAVLIAFLIKESLQNSGRNTDLERSLRNAVSELAAENYLQRKDPVNNQNSMGKVLVFLPTYNEQDNIPSVISKIKTMLSAQNELAIDVCFIDDGSTDDSRNLLKKGFPGGYTFHMTNRGVSGGLLTAIKILKWGDYDFIVQCDADGQHPIELIPNMVKVAMKNGSELLIGSRFTQIMDPLVSDPTAVDVLESTTWIRKIGSICIRFFIRLFGSHIIVTDPTSGFRVYSRKACLYLEKYVPDDYPEPESIALLALKSFKIHEVRVRMMARTGGSSSISGLKSIQFMIKVCTALLSLKIRNI